MQQGRSGAGKVMHVLAVGLGGTVLASLLWTSGWLDAWEAKTWDWRVRLLAEKGAASDDICLILLDQNSLDWGKTVNGWPWPWPREVYTAIIAFCQRSGAKALALDVLFTEPSRYGVEDDQALGRAISDFGRVAAPLFLGKTTGDQIQWPQDVPAPDMTVREIGANSLTISGFPRAAFPIPEVAAQARTLCNVHLDPDEDGVYRRGRVISRFDGKILPALGIGAYLAAGGQADVSTGAGYQRIGPHTIPIDQDGMAILRYRGPSGTHKTYSAAAVIQSEIRMASGEDPVIKDPAPFKDKYVFLGFSAPGLYDLRPSPVSGVYPGVEVQATLLDNLLSGDFIREPPAWAVLTLLTVLAGGCAGAVIYSTGTTGLIIGSFLFFLTPIFLAVLSYIKGFWLPLTACEACCGMTIFSGLALKYTTEGRQKRFIKNAFRQYLSPDVIEQVLADPEKLRLGGEKKALSIFFSDLQGFTTISESLEPEALAVLLNEYLSAMTDIIIEEGGTVDKYEGDAIIAFWNAPLAVPRHAEHCVRAALRCQKTLAHMRPDFLKKSGHELFMRIGMNTGHAVVGNFGSSTKFDYTILGDTVNLAARLEGTNKVFGTYTMISGFTRRELGPEFAVRELGRVTVVGKKEPITVYEPMFEADYGLDRELFETFARALNLFYEGSFTEALDIFISLAPRDPAAAAYAGKCRELITDPPSDWNGVWRMTRK
jgi:adenylate cyclase